MGKVLRSKKGGRFKRSATQSFWHIITRGKRFRAGRLYRDSLSRAALLQSRKPG